jgi:PadR family transcriptional regulator PadR
MGRPETNYLGEFEQLVLLALLQLEGEGYGMQVRREIESRAGRQAAVGAVYATLDRLEQKGLVSSRLVEEGGRPRRLYRINADGVSALKVAREAFERMMVGLKPRWRPT